MRSLVPAYIWAGDGRRWQQLLDQRPDALVLNPASGPPDPADRLFRSRAEQLVEHAASTPTAMYGYVAAGWLRGDGSSVDHVRRQAERWRSALPTIDGIFVDESPSGWRPGDRRPLERLLDACTLDAPSPSCRPSLVLNPGTTVDPDWQAARPGTLWCTFEGRAGAFLRTPRPPGDGTRQVALVHSCRSRADRDAVDRHAEREGWEWSFATTGRLPNPWSTVPRTSQGTGPCRL